MLGKLKNRILYSGPVYEYKESRDDKDALVREAVYAFRANGSMVDPGYIVEVDNVSEDYYETVPKLKVVGEPAKKAEVETKVVDPVDNKAILEPSGKKGAKK